ncbi:MAG: hypothetical protein ABUL62_32370 [Myxococcales bacterium]
MKLLVIGVASLFSLSACGSEIIVGGQGAGSSGLGSSGGPNLPGAGSGGSNPWSDPTDVPECSASPASFEDYTTSEELNGLLIGQWRRCLAPQIPGEDIGVEFTDDGKFYPLTSDETQQIVRRTGVNYEGSWVYSPPGSEDPISHRPSTDGFMELNGVITSVPDFTNDPRQLWILFSPVQSRYVPLLP